LLLITPSFPSRGRPGRDDADDLYPDPTFILFPHRVGDQKKEVSICPTEGLSSLFIPFDTVLLHQGKEIRESP
jgi:hypothetical protein